MKNLRPIDIAMTDIEASITALNAHIPNKDPHAIAYFCQRILNTAKYIEKHQLHKYNQPRAVAKP